MNTEIEKLNSDNSEFWEMICGSGLAKDLGATDNSLRSLAVFDAFYLAYYSYVFNWLDFNSLANKNVLEVGLGYGTISQFIASSRANYSGLDIAKAPVGLVNLRLKMLGLEGRATQGSILDAPFESETFDCVVAFGCLHHTGNIQKALLECSRLLKPGGKLVMMVYYSYSYRMWWRRKLRLIPELIRDWAGSSNYSGDPDERALYDANADGTPAPHTAFVSKRQLRRLAQAAGLRVVRSGTENAIPEPPFTRFTREQLLKTVGRYIGGDLYAILEKV